MEVKPSDPFVRCCSCEKLIPRNHIHNNAHTVWTEDDVNAYPNACGPVKSERGQTMNAEEYAADIERSSKLTLREIATREPVCKNCDDTAFLWIDCEECHGHGVLGCVCYGVGGNYVHACDESLGHSG